MNHISAKERRHNLDEVYFLKTVSFSIPHMKKEKKKKKKKKNFYKNPMTEVSIYFIH